MSSEDLFASYVKQKVCNDETVELIVEIHLLMPFLVFYCDVKISDLCFLTIQWADVNVEWIHLKVT